MIPYTEGPDYKESWLMKMVMVGGLVFPELAAHCLQDYVTAIRLGSLPVDLQTLLDMELPYRLSTHQCNKLMQKDKC
jgi:hypothetical protein